MRYEYKGPGAPNIPAEATAAELLRIKQRDGGITPAVLVDESRPEEAPLHPTFEWDDDEAAELYRQVQARQIIRSVVLVPQPELHETAPIIRAFVSIHNPEGTTPQARIYRPTLEVLQDPAQADEVKRRFRHELLGLRQRYLALLEADEALQSSLQQVVDAIA